MKRVWWGSFYANAEAMGLVLTASLPNKRTHNQPVGKGKAEAAIMREQSLFEGVPLASFV